MSDSPEKAHAELGASVASRWVPCPGSIQLSREVPVPPQTSYAQEGTRAHAVGEKSLRKNVDADFWVGMDIEGGTVTEEMAEHVQVYVDVCRPFVTDQWHRIEHKFNLAALNPPGPMYGTADFVAYAAETSILHVVDLKYGMGVVVEVKGNVQLRYYALGVILTPEVQEFLSKIKEVWITIVQPRVNHPDGIVRTEKIKVADLIGFANELLDAARRTQEPNAPLSAGPHCRFCPASGVCPEQRKRALAVAQTDFEVVQEFVPPAPQTIPPAEFAKMLGQLHIFEDWAAAMRAHAQGRLEHGEEVPGFKLVAKRATRKWLDDTEARTALLADGYREEEIYETPALKSVAQVEKMLGKKPFAAKLSNFVIKKSSGHNMVPVSHPGAPIAVTAGEEFAALPSGE